MKKTIISAPFGTYIRLPGCTSTRGTYTHQPRPGAIWGALTRIDIPYPWEDKPITNRMGLRNPGIESQNFKRYPNAIWSLGGFNYLDWVTNMVCADGDITVELNVSCPNVETHMSLNDYKSLFKSATVLFEDVIVKLPPTTMTACTLIDTAYKAGIRKFHCCNTMRTDKGGASGRCIQQLSIPLIKMIKREYPDATVIGGGGIYTPNDVKRYRDAGADHFALGTIFFTPWRIPTVLKEINK